MRRWLVAFLGALALAGCADDIDKLRMGRLEPGAGTGWRYAALAGGSYPEGDPAAEATRLRWLDEQMTTGRVCPAGYRVAQRRAIFRERSFGADVYDVFYDVECA